MQELTKEQAAIISAYTGILCGKFSDFHEYVENVMQRPVLTHEIGEAYFMRDLKQRVKPDFMKIINK